MERNFRPSSPKLDAVQPAPKAPEAGIESQEEKPAKEVELKYLIDTENIPELSQFSQTTIEQGYLLITDEKEERVRKKVKSDGSAKYVRTIKEGEGVERREKEGPISEAEFAADWEKTEGLRVYKTRYEIPYTYTDALTGVEQTVTIELDVYSGTHEGLFTAEVEFQDEKEEGGRTAKEVARGFVPPAWMTKDVTEDKRLKNKKLAQMDRSQVEALLQEVAA